MITGITSLCLAGLTDKVLAMEFNTDTRMLISGQMDLLRCRDRRRLKQCDGAPLEPAAVSPDAKPEVCLNKGELHGLYVVWAH